MINAHKRGQVTIFVIVAIVLAGGIIWYFSLDRTSATVLSTEFSGVYEYYVSCLEEITQEGIRLIGSGGGYIEAPQFEAGSPFMPFSNQLNFMGQGVAYWMYVSGNNLFREQVPAKFEMEEQLGTYIAERLETCDFSDFEARGHDVYTEEGAVDVVIEDDQVTIEVKSPITFHRGDSSAVVETHEFSVASKLGSLYGLALQTYEFTKSSMFLERYALDVLRLYAPVTGTEVSCTPKVFVEEQIRRNITQGLASNIATLKLAGDYYSLGSSERNYFVVDPGFVVTPSVNFMYDATWPTRIEIFGDKVAKPVGLEEGLGVLGFCYVPYHLVYDISFPVVIQFFEGEEFFQFPVSVVISKNQAREALPSLQGTSIESPICETRNQDVTVETYDLELQPVESHVEFRCLNSVCSVGETKLAGERAVLKTQLPQCVNGFVIANAEGYVSSKQQISTNGEEIARIVLSKKHKIELDLGEVEKAMVTFATNDYSTTLVYPDQTTAELIEGQYNITVYAYSESALQFPATNKRRCVDVPESGIAGFLGAQKEQCFDINLPETEITFAVVGGGKTTEYITSEQLESNELQISLPLFGIPQTLEELQINHAAIGEEKIYIDFA